MWHTGLVAPRHVRSYQTRDRTYVPGIGRRILGHWTTREVRYKFKWSIIYKNVESLCCTLEVSIIL